MDIEELKSKVISVRELDFEMARRRLWDFCTLLEPDFYNEKKPHLKRLCNTLDDFYNNRLLKDDGTSFNKLMIRLPPQYGKSRTLINFTKWVLGKNNKERIITGSYNDSTATDFSKYCRDGIAEIKNMPEQIVYSDIFPKTKIKKGDAAVQKWALEGQHFNYLGVGVGGGVTGKGATIRIVDDLIKDAETALNDNALNKIWVWLAGTFSSRNAAGAGAVKEIYCATLWGENDPQYTLQNTEPGEWYILSMPAYNEETDEMLCDEIMNKESFMKIKARMMIDDRTKIVFYANYMCQAIDQVGDMKIFPRSTIKTYRDLPDEPYFMFAFIDPADEGKDYFAMPIFRVYKNLDRVYLIDAIFDQSNLSIQEIQVKLKCKEHNIRNMVIETNSAGAYFVRRLKENLPQVEIFGQWSRVTKIDRMLNVAGMVKYALYVPEEPNYTTQTFMEQVYAILKTSKDKDDAPDALCGAIAFLESHFYMFKME